MGALFGFSGSMHPSLLQRMATVLSHRGKRQLVSHSTSYGSMGYRPQFELAQRQTMGAGLYRDGKQVIALAGYLIPGGRFTSDTACSSQRLP